MEAFTQTPPGVPRLDGDREGAAGQSNSNDESSSHEPQHHTLFQATNRRRDFIGTYPELEVVCDRIGFIQDFTLAEWSPDTYWPLLELARAAKPPRTSAIEDWTSTPLPDLVEAIVRNHHGPLRDELQRLAILVAHCANCYPDLRGCRIYFDDLHRALLAHLQEEETSIFPTCLIIDRSSRNPSDESGLDPHIAGQLRGMRAGHHEATLAVAAFSRQLETARARHADPDLQLALECLAWIKRDLDIHSTVESDILAPAVLFAYDLLQARKSSRTNRHVRRRHPNSGSRG